MYIPAVFLLLQRFLSVAPLRSQGAGRRLGILLSRRLGRGRRLSLLHLCIEVCDCPFRGRLRCRIALRVNLSTSFAHDVDPRRRSAPPPSPPPAQERRGAHGEAGDRRRWPESARFNDWRDVRHQAGDSSDHKVSGTPLGRLLSADLGARAGAQRAASHGHTPTRAARGRGLAAVGVRRLMRARQRQRVRRRRRLPGRLRLRSMRRPRGVPSGPELGGHRRLTGVNCRALARREHGGRDGAVCWRLVGARAADGRHAGHGRAQQVCKQRAGAREGAQGAAVRAQGRRLLAPLLCGPDEAAQGPLQGNLDRAPLLQVLPLGQAL